MKKLSLILVTLLITVSITLVAKKDSGYAMLSYGHWSVEMSLVLLVIWLVVLFGVLYFLMRFFINLWHMPARTKKWNLNRHRVKASHALTSGLVELVEGQWQEAEKHLVKHVRYSDTPLLNYLAAARAAQELGAYARRDKYLMLAHQSLPSADIAVGLTQAELQICQGQYEQGLASLEHLRQIAPNHGHVLKLLVRLYTRLDDWKNLLELLPVLRKRKLLEETKIDQLELRCYCELFRTAAGSSDIKTLLEAWNSVPKDKKANKKLIAEFCRYLVNKNHSAPAEPLLRDALNKEWDSDLVYLYGIVDGGNAVGQLNIAEGWLKNHENDAMLLLTLGHLCLRNRLWPFSVQNC